MEKLHSFHVDAVYVHFSSEKSSDNQLSFDSIVAQSIWHAVVLAFIFRRTRNPNPAEVGIQEDDSVVLFVSHGARKLDRPHRVPDNVDDSVLVFYSVEENDGRPTVRLSSSY